MNDVIYWLAVVAVGLIIYRIIPKFIIGAWPFMAFLRDVFIAVCIGGATTWFIYNIFIKGS